MVNTSYKTQQKGRIVEVDKRYVYNQIWREFAILSKNIRKANSLDNLKSSLGIVYSLMKKTHYPGDFRKERAILNEFVKTLIQNQDKALNKFDITIAKKHFVR
jgi:hypothetical protein